MAKSARKTKRPQADTNEKKFGARRTLADDGPLWQFESGRTGRFVAPDAHLLPHLYFPLCNLAGMKSSVTPELKGDICTDYHHYLTIPTVTEDLHRVRNSRNVWVLVDGKRPWSATGVSAAQMDDLDDGLESIAVEGEPGVFRLRRRHRRLGLQATSTVFVPADDAMVEVLLFELTNVGRKPVDLQVAYALPIFGRTADQLRDHRHVTTMCNLVKPHRNGVIVRPKLFHDERGHRPNETRYAVMGRTGSGKAPEAVWANMVDFIGRGSLEQPEALVRNLIPTVRREQDAGGREAVGAFRFAPTSLQPGETVTCVMLSMVADTEAQFTDWMRQYGNAKGAQRALAQTRAFWQELSGQVRFETGDEPFDNWVRWVACQTIYRKVYGNSYLLDYGYGRGGRGWRDLWQDLLALFLVDPAGTRGEILNNFRGVRIDGSNATIVGTRPGEFKADRNDIPRVWCDHAAWPYFVVRFYIDQTGDWEILRSRLPYWKDHLAMRCRERDTDWDREQGHEQRTGADDVWQGSVLEHLILELLSSFYHVGEHNNVLLEGADWNDTYDGARERGESVCFTHFYAGNLLDLAAVLEKLVEEGVERVGLLDEMLVLLDRLPGQQAVDYADPAARRQRLNDYMQTVRHTVGGTRQDIDTRELAADLRAKGEYLVEHLRRNEWLETDDGRGFFNGHYDDHGRTVHGYDERDGVRMDLTSQVIPTIFHTGTREQLEEMYKSARKYLRDPVTKGLRVSTEFKDVKLDFGRVTGYVFGYKEHGSTWNQQNIMYAYGLYRHGLVKQGGQLLEATVGRALNSGRTRLFPCIPSFFNRQGRGDYSYLTGSSSWLLVTLATQVYGVRGDFGDLVIAPQLSLKHFGGARRATLHGSFRGRTIAVTFENPDGLEWNKYEVATVEINGQSLDTIPHAAGGVRIPYQTFADMTSFDDNNVVTVHLTRRRRR